MSLCGALALLVAYVPEHAGLSEAGRASLAITVLAAGLWISEVLPAFAVALLVVALLWLTESLHGQPSALVAFLPRTGWSRTSPSPGFRPSSCRSGSPTSWRSSPT